MAPAALDGKVFVVGGVGTEGLANELYVYDTAADRWVDRRPAPTRRDHLAAAALHGQLYVAGGREQTLSKNLATLEVYDPATNPWIAGPAHCPRRGRQRRLRRALRGGGRGTSRRDPRRGRSFRPGDAAVAEPATLACGPPRPRRCGFGERLYLIGGGKHPGLSVSDNVETLEVR